MGVKCYYDERERNMKNEEEIKEKYLKGYCIPLNDEDKQIISQQMKNSICKIITNSSCGTGFFGLIRFPNQKMIKALFTCHHNLVSENSKEIQKSFQYSIGINEKFIKMEINDSRFVYQNKEYDIVIIEILESDKIEINSFLEIDDN